MCKTSKYRLDIWEMKRNQNATLLTILFRPFGFIAPKTWSYLAFQSFDSERTWRLFQKHVVRIKLDIYLLLQSMKYSRAKYTIFFF